MATYTVVTSDEQLVDRMRIGLDDGDVVRSLTGGLGALLPRPRSGEVDLIVLDLRSGDNAEYVLSEYRQRVGRDRRIVAIGPPGNHCPKVLGSTARADLDTLLDDQEGIGTLVRAIANDAAGTACAAITLSVACQRLAPTARSVARTVLASGLEIRHSNDLSRALGVSASLLAERLRSEHSLPPAQLKRRVRVLYALALARRVPVGIADILTYAGVTNAERFGKLCQSVLGAGIVATARSHPELSLSSFLEAILDEYPGLLVAKTRGFTRIGV